MKKLLLILICCFTVSCAKEPIEKYCGGIVVHKSNPPIGAYFNLKYNGGLTGRIYLYEIDYKKYEIGDTIKCSTTDSIAYRKQFIAKEN